MQAHKTHETAVHHPTTDRWQAECKLCGKVGPVCDFEADARAIADRHTEIGGFER